MNPVLRIRNPDCLFDPWIRDPGWVKNKDPDPGSGSGMNNPDHIPRALKLLFWVKILKFFAADPDPCFLFLVCLHPMTKVGSLRMCLDPDVVPLLAGCLLLAVLGVLRHILSVAGVCVFKTAHCFGSFYVS
jgi:hypothetical protein